MITKINNERDFLAALNRLDALMFRALPGTPEGDELEKLSKLIEDYENKHAIVMTQSKMGENVLKSKYGK